MRSIVDAIQGQFDGPVLPEEEMARATKALAEAADTAADAAEAGGYGLGVWIFLGVVVLAVVAMFLMIVGRTRRRRMAEYEERSPLRFDDEAEEPFVFAEGETLRARDPHEEEDDTLLSEVPPVSEEDALETVAAYDAAGAEAAEEEAHAMADPHDLTVDDTAEDDSLPAGNFRFAAQDAGDRQNVVPLRASDEESADQDEPEEPRRYAFATGRGQRQQQNDPPPAPEPQAPQAPHTASSGPASSPGHDDPSRPYVAPFIRDDIERAERRQSDRIDHLRDEFSRQFQLMKTEQSSRLDLVISAIDRKLDSLDRHSRTDYSSNATNAPEPTRQVLDLADQVDRISAAIEGQGQRIRAITQILENRFSEMGQVYEEVKGISLGMRDVRDDVTRTASTMGEIRGDVEGVKENVGRLERAILDRAAQDSSVTHRLQDVIRGTLPTGSYRFGETLENGELADCLISFDGLRQKVAIDGNFPMEAFHELPSRDAVRRNLPQAKAAEDGFRRAILRSILEAADRCIAPPQTADSCVLFLPSEAAYTILHDRFPDLVRDSQRARVWLVSPSTLMGTLNLMRNILPDAEDLATRAAEAEEAKARKAEEDRLRGEVESLRRRASRLGEELERTRGTLRDLIGGAGTPAEDTWAEPETDAEIVTEAEAERYDGGMDDLREDIIDSLRFEGTPEWREGAERPRPKPDQLR